MDIEIKKHHFGAKLIYFIYQYHYILNSYLRFAIHPTSDHLFLVKFQRSSTMVMYGGLSPHSWKSIP